MLCTIQSVCGTPWPVLSPPVACFPLPLVPRSGISGGERRRLTCGEVLVGDREFIAMDEVCLQLCRALACGFVRLLN